MNFLLWSHRLNNWTEATSAINGVSIHVPVLIGALRRIETASMKAHFSSETCFGIHRSSHRRNIHVNVIYSPNGKKKDDITDKETCRAYNTDKRSFCYTSGINKEFTRQEHNSDFSCEDFCFVLVNNDLDVLTHQNNHTFAERFIKILIHKSFTRCWIITETKTKNQFRFQG